MAARLRRWWGMGALSAIVVLTVAPLVQAKVANTPQAPFHVGRMWMNDEYDGAEGWSGSMVHYPAGIPVEGVGDNEANRLKRSWVGHGQKTGSYLQTIDWTAPATDTIALTHEFTSSYFFRSMNYNYPAAYRARDTGGNFNYLYPGNVQEKFRWARPDIIVRNAKTTLGTDTTSIVDFFPGAGTPTFPDNGGIGPRPDPIVVPTLITEASIELWWRYIQGVEYRRSAYAYPYGSAHQDYVLWDIKLKNNGISGRDASTAPILTGQTINKMVWAQGYDFRDNHAPGSQVGMDTEAEFIEPWGQPGHKAVMFWDGNLEIAGTANNPGPDYGDPSQTPYYQGHLLGNAHVLLGALFASKGPAANYAVDDTAQPAFRMIWNERGLDYAGQPYSPKTPAEQRDYLVSGDNSIPLRTNFRDDPLTAPIADTGPGPTVILGYGAVNADITGANIKSQGWDLAFTDSVRIVQVWAAGGIDQEEGRRIGQFWNAQRTAVPNSPETWMSAADQALIATGRDTVMKAAALAYWNFNGTFPPNVGTPELTAWGIPSYVTTKPALYNQPYNVPEAPRPPGAIITRATNAGNEVRWTKESEQQMNDFDTGVPDVVGYKVYRQATSRTSPWVLISSGPVAQFTDAPASGDLPAGRIFVDATVTPNQSYWYAVTAYDDGTQNWAEPGQVLESSRWWTWTGYSPLGTVATQIGPGAIVEKGPARFALEQNVPNPFNPATTITFSVAAASDVKLAIYSANGQIVRTLVNGTMNAGTHQVVWNGLDQNGRAMASGVYVYRLVSGTNTITRRMVLVR